MEELNIKILKSLDS